MPTRSHTVRLDDRRFVLRVGEGGEVRIDGIDEAFTVAPGADGMALVETQSGRRWQIFLSGAGDRRQVFVDGESYEFEIEDSVRQAAPGRRSHRAHAELLTVPMPARVVKVLVTIGQPVHRGDIVMKLEAMKMELPLRAPRDGTVRAIACREGDLVQPGVSVLEIA